MNVVTQSPLRALAGGARHATAAPAPAGMLRIGTIESAAAARLPALLAAYHTRWPGVGLDMRIGTSQALVEDVVAARLDCAFVARTRTNPRTRGEGIADGLAATLAFEEDLLLLLPPHHPPVRRAQDVRRTTLAVFARGCTYRDVLERWLGAGAHPAGPSGQDWNVSECASYPAIVACVAAGACIALCPRSVLARQRVAAVVQTRRIATVGTYLIAQAGYRSPAYDALHGTLLEQRREDPSNRHVARGGPPFHISREKQR